jgi:hypothetical protein
MADRDLFPDPPEDGVLVPAPVHEVEPLVREYWDEALTIPPALKDSFWEVVLGTGGYCAVLDYRRGDNEIEGLPRSSPSDMSGLAEFLGFHFLGRRLYRLHFRYDDGPMVDAYEFHAFGDSQWIDFRRLRKLEPGIPKDPWDFAESRGVMVQRWPEPEPSPPVHEISIIENSTPDELRPLSKGFDVTFHPVSRGTLVAGPRSSSVAISASDELKRTVYILSFFPTKGQFVCTVFENGYEKEGEYVSPPGHTQYPKLDSVLGETTPRGILRALEVPPELVGLEPDASPGA